MLLCCVYRPVSSADFESLCRPRPGNYAFVFHLTSVGLTFDPQSLALDWRSLTLLVECRCLHSHFVNVDWSSSVDGSTWRTLIYDYGSAWLDFQLFVSWNPLPHICWCRCSSSWAETRERESHLLVASLCSCIRFDRCSICRSSCIWPHAFHSSDMFWFDMTVMPWGWRNLIFTSGTFSICCTVIHCSNFCF